MSFHACIEATPHVVRRNQDWQNISQPIWDWLEDYRSSLSLQIPYHQPCGAGIVFEGFDKQGVLRAICGGGRYDGLLGALGGENQPMCGFGFGDAVIMELLQDRGLLPDLGHEVRYGKQYTALLG